MQITDSLPLVPFNRRICHTNLSCNTFSCTMTDDEDMTHEQINTQTLQQWWNCFANNVTWWWQVELVWIESLYSSCNLLNNTSISRQFCASFSACSWKLWIANNPMEKKHCHSARFVYQSKSLSSDLPRSCLFLWFVSFIHSHQFHFITNYVPHDA